MALTGQCLGVLAGSGQLPLEVAAAAVRQGRKVHVVGIVGEADRGIERFDHSWISWGQIGAMLRALRRAGCRDVVIIGGARRPDLRAVRPDAGFFLNLPMILSLKRGGDDSVLRRVIRFFEQKGFDVLGVQDIAPDLLAGTGALGVAEPRGADELDIITGFRLIEALGPFDVGQAVVVADGKAVAIEAAEGTDSMLRRLAEQRKDEPGKAPFGVLIKAPKRGQELRIDMPAIGPRTTELVAAAKLRGIALAAGRVLVAGRDRIRCLADERGLFVFGADAVGGPDASTSNSPVAFSQRVVAGSPTRDAEDDIACALGVAAAAAPFSAGDAVVSVRRHVLAVGIGEPGEAVIERAARHGQWGDQNRRRRRRQGVAVIRSRPTPALLAQAARANLAGVVARPDGGISAVETEAARRHGLFLITAEDHRAQGRGAMLGLQDRGLIANGRVAPCSLQPGVPRPLSVFIVAGEHSGDALGGKLMSAMRAQLGSSVTFAGVGGEQMAEQGLDSLFPLADVAVMGPLSILPRLPRIVRRVYRTVDAAIAARPDVVLIVDSPEFTHPIAKRIRKRCPEIPIVDYVSPSVWAWRPGRARKMRPYVDHVLGILPFEPEAHSRLGGPPCTYVGHPLIERLGWLRSLDEKALARKLELEESRPVLVVLPGSRSSEVERLMQPFGGAIAGLVGHGIVPEVIVPTLPHVRSKIECAIEAWPIEPHLVEGEEDKFCSFKLATAALAASGTVTLELALAGTPMVVAYRVDPIAARLRFLVKVPSVVLANLVLGENIFPELIQEDCTANKLASALRPLFANTRERTRQLEGLARIPGRLELESGTPSESAAEIVHRYGTEAAARFGAAITLT